MFGSKRSGRANTDAEVKSFPLVICVDCVHACTHIHTHTDRAIKPFPISQSQVLEISLS